MRYTATAVTVVALIAVAQAAPAASSSGCGTSVVVERGDNLSRIAERCDVTERSLLNANPNVQGSGDLQVGESLSTVPSGGLTRTRDALGTLANEADDAANTLADKLGSSAQDLLDKNPDLKSRLQRLGNQIGVTSERGPSVTVAPQSGRPGATVTVSATGLPPSAPILIGAGAPGSAYEIIRDSRTSSNGTVEANVPIPQWAPAPSTIVFVITDEQRHVEARSGVLQVGQ